MAMFDPRAAASEGGGASEVLPPGRYLWRLVDLERAPAKDADKADVFKVQAEVLEDAHEGKYRGARVMNKFSLSEAAAWKIGQLCIACGVAERFDIDDEAEVRRLLVGRIFKSTTKMENWQGKDNTKFDQFINLAPDERERLMAQHGIQKPGGSDPFAGIGGGSGSGGGGSAPGGLAEDLPF